MILKFVLCSFTTELPEVFSVLRLSSFSISLLTTGLSWFKVEAFRSNLHQYRLTTIVNNTCSQQKKYFYVSLLMAIALFLKPFWLKNPNCKPIYRELRLVLNSSTMLPQEIVFLQNIGAVRKQFNMKFAISNRLIQNAYTLVTWKVEWY